MSGYGHIETLNHEHHEAHEDYVITLMLAGFVTLESQQTVQVTPGNLTLVPSGTQHALLSGKDMLVHWMSFQAVSLGLSDDDPVLAPFQRVREGALPLIQLSDVQLPWAVQLFEKIQAEIDGENNKDVLRSLVTLLLNEAKLNQPANEFFPKAHTQLGKAIQFIEQHSHQGISLRDVAEHVHLSAAHLATKMKATTGYSVGQWIQRNRIRQACDYLANTDQTIEEIASALGWQDVTHFIRQFKKLKDETPAAWRRAQRKANETTDSGTT
jgi:AraC-like DNA-binding protein